MNMRISYGAFMLILACTPYEQAEVAMVMITTPDRTRLLYTEPVELTMDSGASEVIQIDTSKQFQAMEGFGYTLTGGSAMLMMTKLNPAHRTALLRELFGRDGIGISYLRISIGASDLDERVFSYNDLQPGETDTLLSRFSVAPDKQYLIPVLKEILTIHPSIPIMGSPWSAPAWMKTNGNVKGGSLKKEFYAAYARYFVRYILAMLEEGIRIDAITIQNEPEHPGNTPSMTMTWEEQNQFIKNHLGPAFHENGIDTKIIIYDHNCDHPEYPINILNDSVTRKYIHGTAFHMYLGEINAMSKVRRAHPDKALYFTEQWTSGEGDFGGDLRWHIKNLIIGAPRNWSSTVLEWNLASDETFNPHTDDGGCTLCQGAITIHSETGEITRNVSYYIIAHASKAVPPGSVRIFSSDSQYLPNVAYRTPAGKKVLIVLNDSAMEQTFSIKQGERNIPLVLPAGSVATVVWSG